MMWAPIVYAVYKTLASYIKCKFLRKISSGKKNYNDVT